MWKVLGKLRCGVCSEIVEIDDKVFLDQLNTITHQKCYHKSSTPQIPIKDEGTFRKMLFKYPFFK
jgi:AAA15 family ATPase/GTPase